MLWQGYHGIARGCRRAAIHLNVPAAKAIIIQMSSPHVLVLEDDDSMQELLRMQLRANGFEVTVAENGLDGLVKLESILPDVILCDLNMPKLDGFGFVEAIKAHERTRQIPVVFLTASSDETSFNRALKVGARYYITKPFDVSELVWKLRRLLPDPPR